MGSEYMKISKVVVKWGPYNVGIHYSHISHMSEIACGEDLREEILLENSKFRSIPPWKNRDHIYNSRTKGCCAENLLRGPNISSFTKLGAITVSVCFHGEMLDTTWRDASLRQCVDLKLEELLVEPVEI